MKRVSLFSAMLATLVMVGGNAFAQTCSASIPASTPTAQFTDNGDGTTTDGKTGLMWKRCAEGQTWSASTCTGTAATYTWQQALQQATTVNDGGGYAGNGHWRLPNIKELESIVEGRCYLPSTNAAIFPNTPASHFWSASVDANGSDAAWNVDFRDGSTGSFTKPGAIQVRLVRAGQSFDSFDLADGTLTVTKAGTGAGTVSSLPSGIDCGATCSAYFGAGVSVTLNSAPASGSAFTGWSGDCTGMSSCTVTTDAPKYVTATFMIPVLTVSKSGNGGGSVTSSPTGIDCGGSCSAPFTVGSTVTLTATPNATSSFTGWSGACAGAGSCTVTMDDAKTVTASFAKLTFPLTVTKAGPGTGTVLSSPSGIDCGSLCSLTYDYGTSLILYVVPGTGSTFAGWSGACTGAGTCQVTIDAAKSVTASFGMGAFTADLSLTQSPSPDPAWTEKDLVYTLTVTNGGPAVATAVTLTDTLPAGSTFVWTSPGCANASGTVSCSLGTLASGVSTQAKVVVRASAAGSITNNATVSGAQTDANPTNNSSSSTITVNATPAATQSLRYRLYSPVTLEHHFTTDLNEYTVLGGYVGTWIQEGTVGKVLNNPGFFNGVTAVPYYRLYNTSTQWHHWTTDVNEYYTLIQFPWWNGEGVDGYILPTITTGATQLYRLLYPFIPGLHHWTIDPTEYGILISTYGWIGEGGSGFVVQ